LEIQNFYSDFFSAFDNKSNLILNFNYTNTVSNYLKNCRNIKQIQIHGELENDKNPVIFGFAANNIQSQELSSRNDNELMRNIKKINYKYTNNEYFLKDWLNSKYQSIIVIIIGHSCGISDLLILSNVFNNENVMKIIPFYYNVKENYLQTAINIDRIIDDYSKKNNEKLNFSKLNSFPECFRMIQKGGANEAISSEFKNFYQKIISIKDPRSKNLTPSFNTH